MYLVIIKYVAIAAAVLGFTYLGYNKIFTVGYNTAKAEYEAKIKLYEDNLNSRIIKIEQNSSDIIEQYTKGRADAAKEYKNILAAAKTKPLVVYQNGTCEITPDFAKAYSEALKRANKK